MSQPTTPTPAPIAIVDSILLPSDFSEASQVAFAHALKAALVSRSRLAIMHVGARGSVEWSDFPGVRETLERWNLLPKGSPRSAIPNLGIAVTKLIAHHNPVKSVLKFLDEEGADLIVIATHQQDGKMHWLQKEVAEPVARKSGQMTLLIPGGCKGFVSVADGSVSLDSVLIPIATAPRPQPAVAAAAHLVQRLKRPTGTFTLLHVGDAGRMPAVSCPDVPGWTWNKVATQGDVIDGIAGTAEKAKAGLIVMATDGRNGFLDALRGSHSERVLRRAACPLLAIPAGG